MNLVFLVQTAILLVLNSRRTTALALEKNFTNGDSIMNFLKNQSRMAQQNFSSFSSDEIQVGNRTIKTMTGSSPRILSDEIGLVFHKNGTITTYNVDGDRKPLITVRAGDFTIDEEIFGLVFPGFSMDLKGMPGNSTSTTNKEKEELKEPTTPLTTPTTTKTTTRTTTVKNPLPHKGPKNSADLGRISVFTTIVLTSLAMNFF